MNEKRERLPVIKLRCFQCGHVWIPRSEIMPVACPYCKTFNWKEERYTDENQRSVFDYGGKINETKKV